jgi:hypothetical protein
MGAAYLKQPARANNGAPVLRPAAETGEKLFSTLQARAALAGYELRRTSDGSGKPAFQVSRWNLARVLPDLGAVEDFLRRSGGSRS